MKGKGGREAITAAAWQMAADVAVQCSLFLPCSRFAAAMSDGERGGGLGCLDHHLGEGNCLLRNDINTDTYLVWSTCCIKVPRAAAFTCKMIGNRTKKVAECGKMDHCKRGNPFFLVKRFTSLEKGEL
jgi:hypothetical protein